MLLMACQGELSGLPVGGVLSGPGPSPFPPGTPAPAVDPMLFGTGVQSLRRMTRLELINTVASLSGGGAQLSVDALPTDSLGSHGFEDDTVLSVGSVTALTDELVAVAPKVRAYWADRVKCATEDEACAKAFVEAFGFRAYRRPLQAQDVDTKVVDYRNARTALGATHREALDFVVSSFLLSPFFQYHSERVSEQAKAGANGWVALDDFELASRVSYTLWKNMPDETLLNLAASGALQDRSVLLAQAQRMMKDARFADSIGGFVEKWAEVGQVKTMQKDTKRFPQFSAELARDFALETSTFSTRVLAEGSGSFRELLTADYSFLNEPLAKFYGVANLTGSALMKTQLDPSERAGILTQGGYLGAHALPGGNSPPRRAKVVVDKILCVVVKPPPPELKIEIPPVEPTETVRESFTNATKPQMCAGCHAVLNPLGFSFEKYDAIGAVQTVENGKPIDSAVSYAGKDYAGAPELIRDVVKTPEVAQCVSAEWFRFAVQRRETQAEAQTLAALSQAFANDDLRVQTLLAYLIDSNSFRFRLPVEGE